VYLSRGGERRGEKGALNITKKKPMGVPKKKRGGASVSGCVVRGGSKSPAGGTDTNAVNLRTEDLGPC